MAQGPVWRGAALQLALKPAAFFPELRRPNAVLNRRLPRITARAVLPMVPLGDLLSVYTAGELTRATLITRRNVRGSRLFNQLCGPAPTVTKNGGLFWYVPKRLPSKHASKNCGPGGEPLQTVTDAMIIFLPNRYRLEMMLNRRLPRTFRRAIFYQRLERIKNS